ncbi:MAG: hypothetical protein NC489_33770 [Ruminococcus flavefaciens]|nr:hypothetical protein [Ruminococcus flavefaciens]
MSTTVLDMPRVVPAGQPNPNTKVVYDNLQEKIDDAIKRNDGKLPITITAGDSTSDLTGGVSDIKIEDIVGYITRVEDTTAHCELNLSGTELLMHGQLVDKGVQFCYLVADTHTNQVDRVLKAALAPLHPQFNMFDVKVSGDVYVENSGSPEKC